MKHHNERCKECKRRVYESLVKIYGKENVLQNFNLDFPNRVEELPQNDFNKCLTLIYEKLQDYRGHREFVRSKKLPNVDFFVKNHFILEFDESQHFTKPRFIALSSMPVDLNMGFSKEKWMELCEKYDKKDNDPPFRDEQRAWYDTIRDFAPIYLNLKPTIRLFAAELVWCSLDSEKEEDVVKFQKIVNQ